MGYLFETEARFTGLPRASFGLFAIADRDERRARIIEVIHPALERLGQDLVDRLAAEETQPLQPHLPRLDWPRGYQPFCTWLALSSAVQGYQAGAQLNVGVHRDHVALRLGWDTSAPSFGRFEFLCRHGQLGPLLGELAEHEQLEFRVYAAADWPAGSRQVFASREDLDGSFDEVRRHGVWWELGRRHELPADLDHVCSPALGQEAAELFQSLLPLYERIAPDWPPTAIRRTRKGLS